MDLVARAIMLSDGRNNPANPPRFPQDFSPQEARKYRNAARAAIEVTLAPLREPSDKLVECVAVCLGIGTGMAAALLPHLANALTDAALKGDY